MLVLWIAVGVALLAAELHHLALYLLFASIGAFAAAATAVAAPDAIALQCAVGIAATASGIVLVRPKLSRVIHRRSDGTTSLGVHGGFVGQTALTLDEIGEAPEFSSGTAAPRGHVRLAGERWLAVADWPTPIAPATEVVVTAVVGTTLHVLPLRPPGDVGPALDIGGS